MERNVDELRIRVIDEFTPHWQLNDEAHRIKHFAAVEACGIAINERLELGFSPVIIMLTAYFHDLFAWSRNNHHQLSGEYIRTTDNPIIARLSRMNRELVMFACAEHRASFEGTFHNPFSELMNSADRELPGDIHGMLTRAMQYRIARGMTPDEAVNPSIQHLKEKFGTGGYARYPDFYTRAFGEELSKQRMAIDALVEA